MPICWNPVSWTPAEGQLSFVQWLLFEEYSLRLCPVLSFLRVGIDFPPPDAWAENMGCQAPRSGPEVQ